MANIKFSNSVKLDQSSVEGIGGIDTGNLLSTSTTYTPSVDCYAVAYGEAKNGSMTVTVAGVEVVQGGSSTDTRNYFKVVIPVKKNQKVIVTNGTVKFYGVKN